MARPKFIPTEEQLRSAKTLAALGISSEGIAKFLRISPKTLRKYFSAELALGSIEATVKVAQTAYNMATSGRYWALTMAWLDKRPRWLEADRGEQQPAVVPDFVVTVEKEEAA
jgi:hypothetical protein